MNRAIDYTRQDWARALRRNCIHPKHTGKGIVNPRCPWCGSAKVLDAVEFAAKAIRNEQVGL